MGDPSFCIFARASFKSSSDFEEEKQRIIDNSNCIMSADNRLICMSKNSSNLEYYLDNVVYDGLAFFIECAVVFDDGHIEYIYANWQDSAGKNEFLDSIAVDCERETDSVNESMMKTDTESVDDYYEFLNAMNKDAAALSDQTDVSRIIIDDAEFVVIEGCLWAIGTDSDSIDAYPWYSCSNPGYYLSLVKSNLIDLGKRYSFSSVALIVGFAGDKIPDYGFDSYPVSRNDTIDGKTFAEWRTGPERETINEFVKKAEEKYLASLKCYSMERLYDTEARFVYRLIIALDTIDGVFNIGDGDLPIEPPYFIRLATLSSFRKN